MVEIIMKCPMCKGLKISSHEKIKSAKITDSYLYKDIIIKICNDCGHLFNELTESEIRSLRPYYLKEYYDSKFSFTKSENELFAIDFKDKSRLIVNQNDVLKYISNLIYFNENKYDDDLKYDFIALDQFLEHCWDIETVFVSINKLLNNQGLLYISVPDGSKYKNIPHSDFKLIKEHIHHFNKKSIIDFFVRNGFTLKETDSNDIDLMNGKLKMPNLELLFQKNDVKFKDGIFCYPVGREFLYYIENSLQYYNFSGFIDDTPYKIGKEINGVQIFSSEIIRTLSEKSTIIITSSHYQKEISCKIQNMDYKGTVKIIP
jgi:SAM-dependent methyltransferase